LAKICHFQPRFDRPEPENAFPSGQACFKEVRDLPAATGAGRPLPQPVEAWPGGWCARRVSRAGSGRRGAEAAKNP